MNVKRLAMALRLLGVGWYVAVCIGCGTYGGFLLDRQLGWSPLLTLLGLGLGIAVAVVGMVRMILAVLPANSDTDTG